MNENERTHRQAKFIDLEKKTTGGGRKTPPPPSRDGIRDFQVVIKFRHPTKEKNSIFIEQI